MLETRNSETMQITLASPEKIRDWSYGEVLKPETINYRTLKPEKDGLFCEKIFGPQKDFECACGKFKRVRYKGVICDKCGVEVTRSKVRRERMGHVELAAPVSHIWFVKGTPSRVALLLDLSPRKLEKVVYFAQYIITHVDEEEKQKAIEYLRMDAEDALEDHREKLLDTLDKLAQARERLFAEIDLRTEADTAEVKERVRASIKALRDDADSIRETIAEFDGKKARRNLKLADDVFAKRGDPIISEVMSNDLEVQLAAAIAAQQAMGDEEIAQINALADADKGEVEENVAQQEERLREQLDNAEQKAEEEVEQRIREDLDPLIDPVTTGDFDAAIRTEQVAEELMQKYPSVVRVEMGAEAILSLVSRMDLDATAEQLKLEVQTKAGQRRKKAMKRLKVVDGLRKSTNSPQWMFFRALPVLPPDLRPMVQLDGGRFATSDLNDLYRRVINRNNRLKRLIELGAPEIIVRNEKRMLQEAVDSLIDNGRRGRPVTGSGSHRLKSLSDMLKGKQGRFRQNLLGKRVDYAGRSVIVVGPELKLHQCGLPRRMALELFKPFLMYALVKEEKAANIKSAKRMVERAHDDVWEVLESVVKQRPVLLNRAPTLHRLGIQAFEPVLVDGSAIQIHPLVCSAFNADFDGDQMAVHVPLSHESVTEARQVMLSTKNLLLPSNGEPTVAPTLDMVIGCYYLTLEPEPDAQANGAEPSGDSRPSFPSFEDVRLHYDLHAVGLHDRILARDAARTDGELVETTVGRVIFDSVIPDAIPFAEINHELAKKALKELITMCHRLLGPEETALMADRIKSIGFRYATQSGTTMAIDELRAPDAKANFLTDADKQVEAIRDDYGLGLMTEDERYAATVNVWQTVTQQVKDKIDEQLNEPGSLRLMVTSGAKGNLAQVTQMAGLRGLMSDPSGRIIELPIRSSFREGLSVLEYFISTHGARKGLADTALRTADSGYLTRRLIDVSQDVIVRVEDCTAEGDMIPGISIEDRSEDNERVITKFRESVMGRYTAAPVYDPSDPAELLLEANSLLDEPTVENLVMNHDVKSFHVRSPMVCREQNGLCQRCYGQSLATGDLVELGAAVGIIAAQSIGEPGTQLTMRTFHTGGIAGVSDITSGLPRVVELFEARSPKGQALIAEIDGRVEVLTDGELRRLRLTAEEVHRDEYQLPLKTRVLVKDGEEVEAGHLLARKPQSGEEDEDPESRQIRARVGGRVSRRRGSRLLTISYETSDTREYELPATARLRVADGDEVEAGQPLTEGPLDPQDMLRILGEGAVHRYLVTEVQDVYRSQGVDIHDKHIEVIVRQMLRKVEVDDPGDSEEWLAGDFIDRHKYEQLNRLLAAEGKQQATAKSLLLGVTKASLQQDSWLAAASFQETTRVLTEAAINGQVDQLTGLKENVIIGKMIPARAKIELPPLPAPEPLPLAAGLPGASPSGVYDGDEDELGELGFGYEDEEEMDAVGVSASGFDEEGGYIAVPDE
ncbi:MAG: DNA-directed RNA polymerase subunit beta' [Chloroflexi bacterium]|nr:DNA-directed RNA polymerase subunit beta' [Chloroflexota bacterium]MYF22629.1 DNA-directed RNA polymerase subunit beta' [Chloroflexota bacterium]